MRWRAGNSRYWLEGIVSATSSFDFLFMGVDVGRFTENHFDFVLEEASKLKALWDK